jgi:iron(III) transport system substrate-binding protein
MTPAAIADTAAAQQEGVVVWYATMNTKDLTDTAAEFERTHPGIKVEALRLGSSQLPARIVTEQRGAKYNVDVISGDDVQVNQLLSIGAFQKYVPASTDRFVRGTIDPNGYWTNLYQNTTVIAWNVQRLAADHLKPPAAFADFAKPEWKGKFGFDTGALNWYLGMVQADRSAGTDLVKRIAGNEPVKTTGHSQTLELLEAGDFDATPTVYGYNVDYEKRAGKPVDFVNPDPMFVTLNPVGLAKNAPHPNAGRLLIDWLTSKEGQTYIVQRSDGEISSRTDVKNNPAIWDGKRPSIIIPAPDPATYNDFGHEFRAIFGLPG